MGPPSAAARRRFLVLITAACVALVPWTLFLALTLPRHYLASHWRLTWVGLNIATIVFLGRTAWLAYRHRQALVISAIVTGTLLSVDAWFDVVTATTPTDRMVSLATAAFGEIPLAVLLFVAATRVLRLAGQHAAGMSAAAAPEARLSHLPLSDSDDPDPPPPPSSPPAPTS